MKIANVHVGPRKLDARSLAPLVSEIDEALGGGATIVLLDMSSVEYIDSVGIAVLIALKRRAGVGRVALAGLRPFVASVVRATHLTDYFDVFPTREAGHAFLSA